MVDITGVDLFFIFFAILIIAIIADFINRYRKVDWQYSLFRATYIGITGVGVIFIFAVLLKPTLSQSLIDQITVGCLGVALATVGCTFLNQLDSNYKQKNFEETVTRDLQQIKAHLGITNELATPKQPSVASMERSPSQGLLDLKDSNNEYRDLTYSNIFLSYVAAVVAIGALSKDILPALFLLLITSFLIIGGMFYIRSEFKKKPINPLLIIAVIFVIVVIAFLAYPPLFTIKESPTGNITNICENCSYPVNNIVYNYNITIIGNCTDRKNSAHCYFKWVNSVPFR